MPSRRFPAHISDLLTGLRKGYHLPSLVHLAGVVVVARGVRAQLGFVRLFSTLNVSLTPPSSRLGVSVPSGHGRGLIPQCCRRKYGGHV
jgi:hypothetical protein